MSAYNRLIDTPIQSVTLGAPITIADNFGDTWVTTLADDGELYTPTNDTLGFEVPPIFDRDRIQKWQGVFPASRDGLTVEQREQIQYAPLAFCKLIGDSTSTLRGKTLNRMEEYRRRDGFYDVFASLNLAPDLRSWKSSGCTFLDGTFYWVVHRDGREGPAAQIRQSSRDTSIIKSVDYGRTWNRSEMENFHDPMFPGATFPTPYFVDYGNFHSVDGSDRYAYAISNNGFWDNGDWLILGRIARDKISRLDALDWEFFVGGDGENSKNWVESASLAKPILHGDRKFGATGATYIPERQRYLLIGWHYPDGGGHLAGASVRTVWNFFEASKPWGPWTLVGSTAWEPQGYYCPVVSSKFQSRNRVYVITAGDFKNWWDYYRLTFVPVDLG